MADSSSTNAVSFSSARTTKRFPSSRCASATKIIRPLESIAETQPKLQPALLRLSVMISHYFHVMSSVAPFCKTAWLSFTVFSAWARRRVFGSADHCEADQTLDRAGAAQALAACLNQTRHRRVSRVFSVKRQWHESRTKSTIGFAAMISKRLIATLRNFASREHAERMREDAAHQPFAKIQ